MRVVTVLLVLGACAAPELTRTVPSGVQPVGAVASPQLSAEPACYLMGNDRHLVEVDLGASAKSATYFHRDKETGEWMENLAVRGVSTTARLAPEERMRTGVIVRPEDTTGTSLTVRWRSRRGSDTIVFPSEEARGAFLGRIAGPRGMLAEELRWTGVVAYERPCGVGS